MALPHPWALQRHVTLASGRAPILLCLWALAAVRINRRNRDRVIRKHGIKISQKMEGAKSV
jgi:hypothetical protein